MVIVEIPKETIQLKYAVVPKHVVIFKDTIVYVGTKPQCHRFVYYMEGASDGEILKRAELIK
tara:strand:+ start:64 stop:249 length:186 start_codon:yes stop_codon:yes gene_type:complete